MADTQDENKKQTGRTDFIAVYQNILERYNQEHAKLQTILERIEVLKKEHPLPEQTPEQIERITQKVNEIARSIFRENNLPETIEEIKMLPEKLLIQARVQVKRKVDDAKGKQNKETREMRKKQRKI